MKCVALKKRFPHLIGIYHKVRCLGMQKTEHKWTNEYQTLMAQGFKT